MNVGSMMLWGLVATMILSMVITAGQYIGWTRMDLPFLLGTMVVPGRDRAKRIGLLLHFVQGLILAALCCAIFQSWRVGTWWAGSIAGGVYGMFLLLVVMAFLPSFHPRMANEEHGPTPTKLLEPPGFLALNYGRRTPYVVMAAHVAFGAVLGAFYHLA